MTLNAAEPPRGVHDQPPASTPRPRAAGRPKSPAVSRGRIAQAVVDLIGERGLHGWSMRDLAAQLGVSTGTITHYFRDKQALLIGAMDAVYVLPVEWERYRTLPPAAQLQRMGEMFVLDDESKRRWGRFWLAYLAGAGHDAVLREHQEARYLRQRRFFARLIAALAREDSPAPAAEAEQEAVRLVALGYGLAAQQIAAPAALPPATARQVLRTFLGELRQRLDRPQPQA